MKGIAFVINLLIPGIGSMMIGKIFQGILQAGLFCIALASAVTFIGLIVALPLWVVAVVWGMLTVVLST